MPRNVEIKARVRRPERLKTAVEAVADGVQEELVQVDTFFGCDAGRLKLRVFAGGSGELIFYQRPDTAGPAESDFSKTPVEDPATMLAVLAAALGVVGVVRKRRDVFFIGQTRIHLDKVDGLGHFVELEVVLTDDQTAADGEAVARALMKTLEIAEDDLIDVAYVDLLEQGLGARG
jgi:predicted adenylyl cyclase CyaB